MKHAINFDVDFLPSVLKKLDSMLRINKEKKRSFYILISMVFLLFYIHSSSKG